MSRKLSQEEYEKTFAFRFRQWLDGVRDPYADNLDMKPQKKYTQESKEREKKAREMRERMTEIYDQKANRSIGQFRTLYRVFSALFCVFLLIALLTAVSWLPTVGDEDRPVNNEVAARYIENGLEETGAVNIVTGMILDYRAFDTLGESHVLFAATCTVLILLRNDDKKDKVKVKNKKKSKGRDPKATRNQSMSVSKAGQNPAIAMDNTVQSAAAAATTAQDSSAAAIDISVQDSAADNDRLLEPKNDLILQTAAKILTPFLFIFGIYVILCGHLGPGGGFSGGAVIGSGLILYLTAFGFEKTEKFFTAKTYKVTSFTALACYSLSKCYSFYTGANGIESIIPLGTPGAILSSGLILVLNICVGIVVAGTMYTFYVMFRKGNY